MKWLFKSPGQVLTYTYSSMQNQMRGLMRYSGQYNLLFCTIGAIMVDYWLEEHIKRDLKRALYFHKLFQSIDKDMQQLKQMDE